METISACPHHGFDTWMLVNHFYDGMSPSMKHDECLKHSDYTRVSLAFSCCFGIIYIVLGVRSLI